MQYHVLVNNACMELTETLAKSDCARPRRNPQENHVTPSTRCAHAETRGETDATVEAMRSHSFQTPRPFEKRLVS